MSLMHCQAYTVEEDGATEAETPEERSWQACRNLTSGELKPLPDSLYTFCSLVVSPSSKIKLIQFDYAVQCVWTG